MAQSQRHHRSKSEVAESKNQTCHKGLRLPKTFLVNMQPMTPPQ
ncbi:Uncharacterised protein [Vibrio cholerae]|nr:Uncharacterised protein [Vibrio cholerae]